jgi:hypothetical protein
MRLKRVLAVCFFVLMGVSAVYTSVVLHDYVTAGGCVVTSAAVVGVYKFDD